MNKNRVKKFRLEDMDYDEVSLVISGDDPTARVVISKTDPASLDVLSDTGQDGSGTLPTHTRSQEDDMPQIRKDDLPDDVREYISDMEEVIDGFLDLLDEDDTEEIGKSDDEYEDEYDDDDDDIVDEYDDEYDEEEDLDEDDESELLALAKSNPALMTIISKAEQRAEAAEAKAAEAEAIAKQEQDLRVARQMIDKASSYDHLGVDTTELAAVLMQLHDESPTVAAKIEEILDNANHAISKSDIFDEFGVDTFDAGVDASVKARAEELTKSAPNLTPEQAMVLAYSENPDQYDAYLKES